ncbi:MAG: aminoglycoside N(3)-acetyltransferase [Acidimicrobiales bacterium]
MDTGGEAAAIERTAAAGKLPPTPASLEADLRALDIGDGDVIMVHSSLSKLGWIPAGATSVVQALLAAVGPTGTVCMPTHSGQLTDPAKWGDPPVPEEWFDIIRSERPVYDPATSPTRGMGQIVEAFRTYPGSKRSAHPILSLAANGAAADQIVENHPLTEALGETSPLARLYELDAKVLLLGVDHGNDTSMHLAEYRAEWGDKPMVTEAVSVIVDGSRRWVEYSDVDHDESDFAQIGEAFAGTGRELSGPVGLGVGRVARQRDLVDFAVTWIEANR